jgi:hypothetical protein
MAISTIIATSSYFAVSMLLGLVGLNAPQKYRPVLTAGLILTSTLTYRNITDANLGFKGSDTMAMFVLFYISHMTCALCMEKYVFRRRRGHRWIGEPHTKCSSTLVGLALIDKHQASKALQRQKRILNHHTNAAWSTQLTRLQTLKPSFAPLASVSFATASSLWSLSTPLIRCTNLSLTMSFPNMSTQLTSTTCPPQNKHTSDD